MNTTKTKQLILDFRRIRDSYPAPLHRNGECVEHVSNSCHHLQIPLCSFIQEPLLVSQCCCYSEESLPEKMFVEKNHWLLATTTGWRCHSTVPQQTLLETLLIQVTLCFNCCPLVGDAGQGKQANPESGTVSSFQSSKLLTLKCNSNCQR